MEITSGFDLDPGVRAALAEDGVVAAARPQQIVLGDGTASSTVDLVPHGLKIAPGGVRKALQIRSEGDVVFTANRTPAPCQSHARGAYRLHSGGGPLTTLHESCPEAGMGAVGPEIALSPGGTVAFSAIVNGAGAIHRGPALGPVSVLRSGNGTFFNTGGVDVNDGGRVTAQMEYFDGFAGGLMRGVLAFDTPEQAKSAIDTAIEKLGIGTQPPHAINAGGTVVFSLGGDVVIPIDGMNYAFVAGVYLATPTLFNTPKSLTLVADRSGGYCRFGNVDINDYGMVVFEAALDGGPSCSSATADGLFTGPDPMAVALVVRGEPGLGSHQFFDDIRLGQINGGGQVAFTTTYSEPLVEPVKVWRVNQ